MQGVDRTMRVKGKGAGIGHSDKDAQPAARDDDAAVSEQYVAGYAARYRGDPISIVPHEAGRLAGPTPAESWEAFEEIFEPSQGSIEFSGCGEEARGRGLHSTHRARVVEARLDRS